MIDLDDQGAFALDAGNDQQEAKSPCYHGESGHTKRVSKLSPYRSIVIMPQEFGASGDDDGR